MFLNTNGTLSDGIAAEIRAELARQRVTSKQLADAVGISRQAVSERLNGHRPLLPEIIEAAAGLLGVKASEFVIRAEKQYAAADSTPTPNPYEKQVA